MSSLWGELVMAPRAFWKGYLKLSMVSCPVALYPATATSERLTFARINRKTGHRVRPLHVDSETGDPVEREDMARGYEIAKAQYITIEDEELEKIRIASVHTIDIGSFIKRSEVDDRYLDQSYYLAPTDRVGQEAFAVIRDAMRDKRIVGLARVVLMRREQTLLLEPLDKVVLATTLRYAYEVRDVAMVAEDIPDLKLPAEMKELAARIVTDKTSRFDPTKFEDRYENALVKLIRDKSAGRPVQEVDDAETPRVINLMDALRASVKAAERS